MRLPRLKSRHLPLGFLLAVIIAGCPPERRPLTRAEADSITFQRLERFESEAAFDGYVARLNDLRQKTGGDWGPIVACSGGDAPGETPQAPDVGDGSITNNQEAGVDEGDIVKAVDDWFVILRRGRLFSVRQLEGGLDPVGQVDAYAPGFTRGTWYDEMLVYGRRIIVVGYSYDVSATEVGLFRLHEDGRLTHEGTHFLSSNDYYSSRNYASRLVGGTLVFYMPYYVNGGEAALPSSRRWVRGDEVLPWRPVLSRVDVYKPLQTTLWPALHTVVRCDLDAADFSCTASALVAPPARTFYVSRDAVYLWVTPGYGDVQVEGEVQDASVPKDAVVYRLPLDGSEPGALRARGSPVDQFSLRQNADGHLDALLTASGVGDAMWGPELNGGDGRFALLRAPLEAFGPELARLQPSHFQRMGGPEEGVLQNRFVGNHVLWGAGWTGTPDRQQRVWVKDVRDGSAPVVVPLGHLVERLEPLGAAGAVVVGQGSDGLRFTTLALGGERPEVRGGYLRRGAQQGETRSHGFFFKPDGTGGGVLGLPVRLTGGEYSNLRHGSAEVTFLRVEPALGLAELGALRASADSRDDACLKSCVDWYGNARPIFYRNRVFAMMGYELVEAAVTADAVQESSRVSFLDPEER
ncbi:MAG TPA: beta-propeller domain-containing protein [Myxococcus sp.]|nr:beta-propeller domain-containing protein [Myxococcus sp.]